MPIPEHDDFYLAQVVLKPDNLPDSNSFVNTWFFRNDSVGAGHAQVASNIATVLNAAYAFFDQFYSARIDPAMCSIRVYDLGDPPFDRLPEIRTLTITTGVGTGLPNEVAAVISYRSGEGSSSGGTSNPRRRGRLFIGPLEATALATGTTDSVLNATFQAALVSAAEDVLGTSQPVTWQQYSRASDVFNAVTGGFVDNAWDTQRRRGAAATNRTVWP